jgi:hypothetical protein
MNNIEQFQAISEMTIPYEVQHKNWISYLTKGNGISHLSYQDNLRISLADFLYKLQHEEGRILYHLSLTYKPNSRFDEDSNKVDRKFIWFQFRYFLPTVLGTKNYHFMCHRAVQPKVLAFLDEHHHGKFTNTGETERLHHHAIIAVLPLHERFMNQYIGENTFPVVGSSDSPIMTSDLKLCSPMRVLYSSKMLRKYPDFLSFPDKMYRTHVKHRTTKHTKNSDEKLEKMYRQFPNTTKDVFGNRIMNQ